MNETQKAEFYGQLLNDHTRLHNQIQEIKGQNLELNQEQIGKVRQLEEGQRRIMAALNKLMS
jgi:hypothetical protein